MSIEFHCHQCQTMLRVGDETAGKQAKCPKCGTLLMIPQASGGEPATAGGVPVVPPGAVNPYQSPAGTGGYAPRKPEFANRPITKGIVDPGQCFTMAWELFTKYLGQSILAGLIMMGIMFAIVILLYFAIILAAIALNESVGGDAAGIAVLAAMFVLGIPSMILSYLLYYNLTKFFLALARNEEPGYGMLFKYESNFWPTFGAGILMSFITTFGFMACIAPGVYLCCLLFPWPMLVLERKLPIGEAFNLSKELTEGNKMNIFVLGLIYMGVAFVAGMIPCGIGNILGTPLMIFILIAGYLMLTGQKVEGLAPGMSAAGTGEAPLPNQPSGGNPFAT